MLKSNSKFTKICKMVFPLKKSIPKEGLIIILIEDYNRTLPIDTPEYSIKWTNPMKWDLVQHMYSDMMVQTGYKRKSLFHLTEQQVTIFHRVSLFHILIHILFGHITF